MVTQDAYGGGLLAQTRRRIVDLLTSVQPAQGKWKVLVADPHSARIINSACRLQEILDCNVTLMEDVSRRRQPYPNKDAVYVLAPAPQSVDALIADFASKRMYAAAHVFFVGSLSDALFARVRASAAAPFIRTLKEVLVDFVPLEARAFSLDEPLSLFVLYNTDPSLASRRLTLIRYLARRLVAALATIGEYPYVRYYNASGKTIKALERPKSAVPDPNNVQTDNGATPDPVPNADDVLAMCGGVASCAPVFARIVQHELDELCRVDDSFPPARPDFERGVLLITDRCLDLVSPFVHEYTYQALISDVLRIENGRYLSDTSARSVGDGDGDGSQSTSLATAQATTTGVDSPATASAGKQKVVIDETDPIYVLIRHWHYVDAVDYIKNAFNDFLKKNKAAMGAMGKLAELDGLDAIKQMKDTLYALPEFQEVKAKFSVHINICQECSQVFERNGTQNTSAIEQDLATGEHADGTKMKQTAIMMRLLPILDTEATPLEDKLRLLMLYAVVNNGIDEEERKQLLGYAHLSATSDHALMNLLYFGVQVGKAGTGPNSNLKAPVRGKYGYHNHRKGRKDGEAKYDVSRWVPIMKSVMEDQLSGTLDTTLFPWTKAPPIAGENENSKSTDDQPQSFLAKGVTRLNFGRKEPSLNPPDPSRPFSLRTTRPTWTAKRAVDDITQANKIGSGRSSPTAMSPGSEVGDPMSNNNGIVREPRLIVFSLGGITYSEIRTAYEVSDQARREILVGGTFLYSPFQMVECMKELNRSDPFGTLPSKWINMPEHKMNIELLDKEEEAREAEQLQELEKTKDNVRKKLKAKRNEPAPGMIERGSKAVTNATESVSKTFKKTTMLAKLGL